MKSPRKPKPSVTKPKTWPLIAIIVGVVVVLTLGWAGIKFLKTGTLSTGNYAEETAKPLEQALVKAGAVKKCSNGDAGRGWDNTEPWYRVYLELPKNNDEAAIIINNIAADNGYNLTHASPSNRGHLGAIADAYITSWYFDNTSKSSPYPDLQDKNIELAFAVNNSGAEKSCGAETPIVVDAGHSVVSIDVQLPEFRR